MVLITAPKSSLYCPLSTLIAVSMECQKYLHFEVLFEVVLEVDLEVDFEVNLEVPKPLILRGSEYS